MQVSDFNYDLPQELIAQTPMEPRDHSRLRASWSTAIFTIYPTTCARTICWCLTIHALSLRACTVLRTPEPRRKYFC